MSKDLDLLINAEYGTRSLGEIKYLNENGVYPTKMQIFRIVYIDAIKITLCDFWDISPLLSILIVVRILLGLYPLFVR